MRVLIIKKLVLLANLFYLLRNTVFISLFSLLSFIKFTNLNDIDFDSIDFDIKY